MGTRKIAVNRCFGGFSLSDTALVRYVELSGIGLDAVDDLCGGRNIPRDDVHLIAVIEELGNSADGGYASLGIAEIPDDIEWHIDEYGGQEHVAENHRTW